MSSLLSVTETTGLPNDHVTKPYLPSTAAINKNILKIKHLIRKIITIFNVTLLNSPGVRDHLLLIERLKGYHNKTSLNILDAPQDINKQIGHALFIINVS